VKGHYAGKPVVVLGATGFIGRWVARKLQQSGAELHCLARNQIDLSVPNVAEVLTEIFQRLRPVVIFNLVGYGVDPRERDPSLYEALNARLPHAIMEAAGEHQNVVHTGSALEYGSIAGDLEESGPVNPPNIYGRSKLAGTLAVAGANNKRGITARLFTVYGPGEHSGRLLPSLIDAARTGIPLDLTAGNQQRDFTYVEDVAESLLKLGAVGPIPGRTVNVATGRLTSVRAFAETAARILAIPKKNLRFGAIPARAEEMSHNPVSIERLRQATGAVPSTDIEDGIRRTVEFHMQH
jgi:UDP-glucose 4-epimerase